MKIKSVLAGCLVFALACTGWGQPGILSAYESQVAAADNKLSSATAIGANKTVSGSLSENAKTKSYKFSASEPGYLTFYIERAAVESTSQPSWKATLYDGKGISVASVTDTNFYTQTVVVDKDGLYYLVIEGGSNYLNEKYSITANFTPCDYVVAEPNEEVDTALSVVSGRKYVGVIDQSSDADYFKISASQKGYATINFDRLIRSSTTQPSWGFSVYDSELNELFSLNSAYNSDALNTKGIVVPIPADKFIIVKVSNGSNTLGVLYSFDATFKAASLVETEPNNTFASADKLKLKKAYVGSLAEKSTNDYFYFKATKTGKYVVNLNLSKSAAAAYKITVYDKSLSEVVSSENINKKGKVSFKAKKGKKYYIMVSRTSSYGADSEYNLLYKVKVTPKA